MALDSPATGVSSLNAICFGITKALSKDTLALLDARRGEVYLSALDASSATILEPQALSYEDAFLKISSKQFVLCGNGVEPVMKLSANEISDLDIAHENAFPEIETVAKLALNQIKDGITYELRPQYLRQADAKPNENFALDRA